MVYFASDFVYSHVFECVLLYYERLKESQVYALYKH
jgi:hypothetical protein